MSIGHNSISGKELNEFIKRIETKSEEKRLIAEDIKEIFSEAKSQGFDVKTMRKLIAIRKIDEAKLAEQESLLDIYKNAIGMI